MPFLLLGMPFSELYMMNFTYYLHMQYKDEKNALHVAFIYVHFFCMCALAELFYVELDNILSSLCTAALS